MSAPKRLSGAVLMPASILFLLLCSSVKSAEFVGSAACASCHETEYRAWGESDHARSMAEADPKNVLGDFSDMTTSFHGIESSFSMKSNSGEPGYFVTTVGQRGARSTYRVKYTFGHYPLQQYLIELDDGHVQALDIAWDSRDKASGGQRWFHLQPDENMTPEHPFFWTRHFQNWNSRCASCHSTNVEKGYDEKTHAYKTTFSEINVACESCHGPASRHLALAESNGLRDGQSGFDTELPLKARWQYSEDQPIASTSDKTTSHEIDTCGRCHSLRTPLKKHQHDQGFLENNVLQPLSSPHYFEDGQIREEVFVLGSFMQSKMYQRGVTCSNCHDPHSGRILTQGNGLCAQCHAPAAYDSPVHHKHQAESDGARCVNCHMPERTYMGVDDRRDHSFTIPAPKLSVDLGVPNACVSCHSDKDNLWALGVVKEQQLQTDSDGHWAYAHQFSQNLDVLATRQVVHHVEDATLPALVRASLLEDLAPQPSRVSVEAAVKQLKSEDPLLRKAAVSALGNLPAQTRWQLLSAHVNDASLIVRFQLASTLADLIPSLPSNQAPGLAALIREYRQSLSLTLDSPATRLTLANLEIRLGEFPAAEQELLAALKIESGFVPAIINLADFYRMSGRDNEVEPLLKNALAVAPDSGAASFSYGLLLIRSERYDEALQYLEAATGTDDATPRYSYVYAVALDNKGETNRAVDVLTAANRKWRHQYDLLVLQIAYLEKTDRAAEILPYLNTLSAVAPASPEVQALVKKYTR